MEKSNRVMEKKLGIFCSAVWRTFNSLTSIFRVSGAGVYPGTLGVKLEYTWNMTTDCIANPTHWHVFLDVGENWRTQRSLTWT